MASFIKGQRENMPNQEQDYPSRTITTNTMLHEIKDLLICPIHQDLMELPVAAAVDCLHRFCRECILKVIQSGTRCCPVCRAPIPTKQSLRADHDFNSLVSVYLAECKVKKQILVRGAPADGPANYVCTKGTVIKDKTYGEDSHSSITTGIAGEGIARDGDTHAEAEARRSSLRGNQNDCEQDAVLHPQEWKSEEWNSSHMKAKKGREQQSPHTVLVFPTITKQIATTATTAMMNDATDIILD